MTEQPTVESKAREHIRKFKAEHGLDPERPISPEDELELSAEDLARVVLRPGALASLHEHEHVMSDWELSRLAEEEADRIQRAFHERHDKPKSQDGGNGHKAQTEPSRLIAGERRTSWSCADLLGASFPEPKWIVPDLLPVGLASLGGRPKLGKSFLGLQLAIAVGSGGRFLDRLIERGRVLCVCLEDSPRRVQDRLRKMGTPKDCDLQIECGWQPLNDGGLQPLQDYIEGQRPRLIIVDTLARAFTGRVDWDSLSETTAIMGELQAIALANDCAILTIDHHRKPAGYDSDLVDDLMGSTGKSAVCDTLWGLYRERGAHGANLKTTGRDIDECELTLRFDKATCCWQLGTSPEGVAPDTLQGRILDLLKAGAKTTRELSETLARYPGHINEELAELCSKGVVIRLPRKGHEVPYALSSVNDGNLSSCVNDRNLSESSREDSLIPKIHTRYEGNLPNDGDGQPPPWDGLDLPHAESEAAP